MSSKILKKEKNIVTIEFTISQDDFEASVNKAYLKVKDSINVQGFRKGKAPRHIIEKKYGKSIFYDDALDIAIQEVYPVVVKENELDVINSPNVNVEKFEVGEDIVITADVEVMPEVQLCEYKGVEVEKFEIKVTDEDVDSEIKTIQDKNARVIEVSDRTVQNGDILTIDYAGFVGEEQFEGGTAENQSLEIGSNSFIPGFEEQLVGKSKDEEVEVNVTFPEEYHSEDLKGKDAVFKVKIHEIKAKELPEIDDEFAKDVSEFDTLEELKMDTRKTLEEKAKDNEKVTNNNNIVTKIVNDSLVEVPEVLIEREIDYLGKNYEQQFRSQGFSGKEMDDLIKSLVDQYKAGAKSQAEFNVKADLVLTAIIDKENIKATEEELDEEVSKLAESYKVEEERLEAFKQSILESSRGYIEESIQKRKVIDMLVENAKLIDKVETEVKEEEK
ncbi:trigger factor [Sedimentibacter acidaminivorans]|jgi:trigger factor|uniref:Trigger factor n=1 Tax=Sedimentibacter acidaminivorans TaxID=913099 RepID=A0ABS4GAZ1_9FIRM|nr:trigger factor [Sedimentibacter acidaminivorans]MBP1924854.1 trigger factor [Sedimentibacter acidaminivorans]